MRVSDAEPKQELVVVLEAGDELRLSLKDLCLDRRLTSLLLQGSGQARRLVLHAPKGGTREVTGPVEVLHLTGSAELRGRGLVLDVRAVTGRAGDLNGGVVQDATFERAVLRCTALTAPIEPLKPQAEPEASPAPVRPAAAGGWAAVAAATSSTRSPQATAEDRPPRTGDLVDHPVFGRCAVMRLDDEHLRIRRDTGRTIALGLSRLRVTLTGEMSDGKRVYRLEVLKAGE
jgi:predicted DNA-binding protein with PD1-like motif